MSANDGELRELVRRLERKLGFLKQTELTCCGVSFTQCHALVEIGRAKSISLNNLAELLNLDASTMSRTVDNLVNKRLAKRGTDKNDRRCIRIELTAKGNALFESIETDMGQYYKIIFEKIPKEKQSQVLESIEILLDAIGENYCCK